MTTTTRKLIAAAALLSAAFTAAAIAVAADQETAPVAAAAPQATGTLHYSNKWRIEVSEGANSDGVIVFNVTPKGGTTQEVSVTVKDGTSENHVARVIRDAFDKQLDSKKFDAETDDGEDVLVEKRHSEPDFALQLVSSTAKSLRLHVEKE
jgi:hypothetical protein